MARRDNPALRAFLRAAAIAFALGGDAAAAISGDAPDGSPRDRLQDETSADTDAAYADIKLLDARGRPRLRLRADGPFTLLPQPPGRYTLLVRRDGLTEIRHIDTGRQPLAALEIAP